MPRCLSLVKLELRERKRYEGIPFSLDPPRKQHFCDLCKAPRPQFFYRVWRHRKNGTLLPYEKWCGACTAKRYLKAFTYVNLTRRIWHADPPAADQHRPP